MKKLSFNVVFLSFIASSFIPSLAFSAWIIPGTYVVKHRGDRHLVRITGDAQWISGLRTVHKYEIEDDHFQGICKVKLEFDEIFGAFSNATYQAVNCTSGETITDVQSIPVLH